LKTDQSKIAILCNLTYGHSNDVLPPVVVVEGYGLIYVPPGFETHSWYPT
jgi:hypothetical protein